MYRKTLIFVFLLVPTIYPNSASANNASSYITAGREQMFDGTLAGLQSAYDTFNKGLNDSNCIDCDPNDELKFLHAITRIVMWTAKDDGAPVDSLLEFAGEFGMSLSTGIFDEIEINYPNYPASKYGIYEMPETTPAMDEIRNFIITSLIPDFLDFIDTSAIPEIEDILADLDSIEDPPSDRFKVLFHPHETGLKKDLEVDYGEVLIIKGLLTILKAQLQFQSAYDMFIDANDMLLEKLFGNSLNIQSDLLDRYPHLLKILPTPNDANDGKLILGQARQAIIDGINNYFSGLAYMLSEEDPQEDDLLYIDARNYEMGDKINEKLAILSDNLAGGTSIIQATRTIRTYDMMDADYSYVGDLRLVFDTIEQCRSGRFISKVYPGPDKLIWQIKDIIIEDGELIAETYQSTIGWCNGLLTATISDNRSTITNAKFEYWGNYEGVAEGLSGSLIDSYSEEIKFDLNPVFGSSSRYKDPVNLRDLLPEFDSWNAPKPDTMGQGLSDDATLGGIFPDATQYYWQLLFDLQPSGLFYLQEVYPWQKTFDDSWAYVEIWLENQEVFEDPSGDTRNDSNLVTNVDIKKMYMGYDDDALYGTLVFHDYNSVNSGQKTYLIKLSYCPDDSGSLHSIKMEISSFGNNISGKIYYMVDYYGNQRWQQYSTLEARYGRDGIDFYIPWQAFPDYLPGRFITVESDGYNSSWTKHDGEKNNTNLKIGEVGRISGVVTCDPMSYQGQPIFIKACTDMNDPENSIVASTMIEGPGPYTLEGIGLGWEGIVQVSMPCYDFDTQGIDMRKIEAIAYIFVLETEITGFDFVLPSCTMPCREATEITIGEPYEGAFVNLDQDEIWHYFVPDSSGVYSIALTGGIEGTFAVYDNCYHKKLISNNYSGELKLNAIGGKIYYVQVEPRSAGDYILLVSQYASFIPNDLCEDAIDVTIDANYSGSTVGALGEYKTSCGYGDKYDVWYKFAPNQDAVYQLDVNNTFEAALVVFDGCGGEELICTSSFSNLLTAYLNAEAGTEYYIRLAGQYEQTGEYILKISQYHQLYHNDFCEDAQELFEGEPYPSTALGAVYDKIWFIFTPITDGIFNINLPAYSAEVTILDGCDGNEVPSGLADYLYFNGKAQKSYLIGIKPTRQHKDQDFTITISYEGQPVPNDHLEDAITIEPNRPYKRTTYLSTTDGKSTCNMLQDHDVWYSFIPESSGLYKTTLSTEYNLGISVLEEGWPLWVGQLSEILCRGPYDSSPAYFYGRAGTTYYIRIAGYWGSTGEYTLVVDQIRTGLFVADLNSDGAVNWADLEGLMSHWLVDCPQSYWCAGNDFNNDSSVDFKDYVFLASEWLRVWR